MRKKLIEILKLLNLFPNSGYGKISFIFQNGKLVYTEKSETQQKFEDE